jgi:predicted O-methyltransferase YrrM
VRLAAALDGLDSDPRAGILRDALASCGDVDLAGIDPAPTADGWGLAPDATRFVVRLVELVAPRHVLELGSGVSTHALGRACARLPQPAVLSSVENDPHYVQEAESSLRDAPYGSAVTVVFAPLVVGAVAGKHAPAYRVERDALASPEPPGVVLVDGPPAALGGRLGSVWQALELVAPDGVVVLDDAGRPHEQEVLDRIREIGARRCRVALLAEFGRGLGLVLPDPVLREGADPT